MLPTKKLIKIAILADQSGPTQDSVYTPPVYSSPLSPSPRASPSPSPANPSPSPRASPSPSPPVYSSPHSPSPRASPSPSPANPSPSPRASPSPSPATPSPSPQASPSPSPRASPSPSPRASPSPSPRASPSPYPASPTPSPRSPPIQQSPSPSPRASPSRSPPVFQSPSPSPPVYQSPSPVPPVYSSPPPSSPPPATCDYSALQCYDEVTGELDADCQCNLGGAQISGIYPAPHDCTKFIYCQEQHEAVDGSLVGAASLGYIRDCPDGLFFNTQLQVCDWPDNIVTSESSSVLGQQINSVDCCPATPPTPPLATCYYSALQCYDEVTGELDADCQCNLGGAQVSGIYPAPHDCTKFIYCQEQHEAVDGSLVGAASLGYIRDCPPGLFFNIQLQVCDWPDKIVTRESSSVLGLSVTSVDCCPIQPLVIASESDCYTDNGAYNATCFCNVGGARESGNFASPADCTRFITCVNNNAAPTIGYNIDCVPTTYYNANLGVCDSMSKLSDEQLTARCPEYETENSEELKSLRTGGAGGASSSVNQQDQQEIRSTDAEVTSTNTQGGGGSSGGAVSAAGIALAAVGGVAAIVGVGGFIAAKRRSATNVANNTHVGAAEPTLLPVAVPAGRVGDLVMGDNSDNLRQRTPRGGQSRGGFI